MTQALSPPIPNVGALVSRAARLYGRQVALTTDAGQLTYAQLEQRANRLANALAGLGVQRADRVAVYLPNCAEVVEAELACYKGAYVKAPINARLSAREVADVLVNAEPRVLITTRQRAEAVRAEGGEVPRCLHVDELTGPHAYAAALDAASDSFTACPVTADDLAVLHYTSGSTGALKAAMQTFGNRLAQLRKFLMRAESLRPGERLGLVGPITHASGMNLVPALCSGAHIRVFSGFEPGRFLADMRAERITHTFLVPTMINMLLNEVRGQYLPLPDLRRMGYGAAPMAPARILQALDVFGPVLSQGYGAGETTSGVCALSVEDHLVARAAHPERLASCGRPFLESEVDILDAHGQPVSDGEIGEIVVGGPDVFAGYWRAPALTAEVLREGRYHTGDLARRDADGFIYIVDRKKDMIISGGFNVYPTEVEAVLYQHPAVADACVFAVPDDTWGETVAAHVVLKAGVQAVPQELDAFCAERLGGFKRPRRLHFVDALPRNPNGKVARKQIQDTYWAGRERRVN